MPLFSYCACFTLFSVCYFYYILSFLLLHILFFFIELCFDICFSDCIKGHIESSETPEVKCPYVDDDYHCDEVMQEREIREV